MKNATGNKYRTVFFLLLGLAISGGSANYIYGPVHAQLAVPVALSQTFTVTTTTDGTGAGTLRTAITNANANPGLDTIAFNISGSGVQDVVVTTSLPTITDPVILDGSTQPGYSGSPLIRVAPGGPSPAQVFNLTGGNSTVRALSFSAFTNLPTGVIRLASNGNVVAGCIVSGNANTQVLIEGGSNNRIGGSVPADRNVWSGNTNNVDVVIVRGATSTGNRIVGNVFGTTAAGVVARNTGNNIFLDLAPNNFVGGSVGTTPGGTCTGECNVISGGADGVKISGSTATGNRVIGNFFGLGANGTTPNGNNNSGVHFLNAPNNQVGGTTSAERNVFGAGFFGHVYAEGTATGNVITGNYIGLNSTGTAAITGLGNLAQFGVRLSSNNNRVGGVTAGERNVISGSDRGVYISGAFNLVEGNYIGTNAAGNAGLTTRFDGVFIEGPDNTIGTEQGTAPLICTGGCNLISGNGPTGANNGVWILGPGATRTVVAYNYIGLNATGTAAIHNGLPPTGHSILVLNSNDNTIGSPSPGTVGREPDSVNPDRFYCYQDDEGDAFVSFTDPGGEYLAKDCVTGETFQPPPPGTFTPNVLGFSFSAPRSVNVRVNGFNDAFFSLDNPGDLTFRNFKNLNNPSLCQCPQVGRQFITDYMDFGGNPGSFRNQVINNFKGVTSDLSTNLAVPNERGIVVTNGTGNVLDNNFVLTLNKPAYELFSPNPIIGGVYVNDGSVPPIASPQSNAPEVTATGESDSVRLVGRFSGKPVTVYEVDLFYRDTINAILTLQGWRSTGIGFDVQTDANGNGTFDQTFSGAEARVLETPPSLGVTAIEEGEVMRPEGPDSPRIRVPVSTSVMSPPITVVTVTAVSVSGQLTTPSGLGLKNAVVSIVDGSGARRTTLSNQFGLYKFDGVLSGGNYTMSVSSKRYRFASRIVSVSGNLTNIDFSGVE
ncbi:hypothetical protein BH10ACI2_BH10ACI2_09540 [soil metagenome]